MAATLRFLVDESAGLAIAQYLRQEGYDVLAVAEITPRANDTDILTSAAREGRIVITSDKDFGELVFRSGQAHQGVLLFRLQDETAENRVRIIASVLIDYTDRLAGNFVVVTERNVRVRPMNLG